MTNQEVNEFMQRFLDDDLNEEELESLMEHIRQSPASAALFERLQRLDSELESLPKVIPPMSIVDSILPRLELAGLIDHTPVTSTTSLDDLPNRVVPMERRTTLRERVNYRLLGGVVAAGVVLTLFFSNFGPQMSFKSANEDAASSMDQMIMAEGSATLKKDEAPIQPQSSGVVQDKAMDSTAQPDEASTFAAPVLPESNPNAPISNDSTKAKSPWVDQGNALRVGAADSPSAPNSPAAKADNSEVLPNSDTSTDNKTFDTANEEPADVMLSMKRSALPAVASPDEKLSGTVTIATEGGQQIIITDPSGQQVYESAIYQGALNELTWSPDSTQLHFEVTQDNEPTVHMTIDLATLTESVKVAE
ncbi:MAG: hypothetical protein WDZ91_16555 [Paenibacillaceae bacterium]